MMDIEAVLFDLGNTLTASASLAKPIVNLTNSPIANELKLNAQQLLNLGEEIERYIGNLYTQNTLSQPHWSEVWHQASTQIGLALNPDEVERLCRAHLKQFVDCCTVEPYSIPLLTQLKEENIPLGLVSNVTGPVDIFSTDLQDKGLASFFDVIVWSGAVNYRKPNTKIFQIALDKLNVTSGKHVVMVGDSEQADVMGGNMMGFTTIKLIKSKQITSSAADYVVNGTELIRFFESALKSK